MGVDDAPRLVVDTNLFRGLDVARIRSLAERGFKLSVSETAISEAWARAANEFASGKSIAQAAGHLFTNARKWAPYVDSAYPVAASGAYALTQIRARLGESPSEVERRESAEHYEALVQVWGTLSTGKYPDSVWLESGGNHGAFHSSVDENLRTVARPAAEIWAEKDERIRDENREARAQWELLPDADRLALKRAYVIETWSFSNGVAERLDALISLTAWWLHVSENGARLPADNDGSDARLPVHLGEGCILLSGDKRFVKLIDDCGTYQAPWVRRLEDLSQPLPDGPPWGENARRLAASFHRAR